MLAVGGLFTRRTFSTLTRPLVVPLTISALTLSRIGRVREPPTLHPLERGEPVREIPFDKPRKRAHVLRVPVVHENSRRDRERRHENGRERGRPLPATTPDAHRNTPLFRNALITA